MEIPHRDRRNYLHYIRAQHFPSTLAGSMVTSICWNNRTNMLAAMQDKTFMVWYHPAVVYADKDLLPHTVVRKEGRWVGCMCDVCGWDACVMCVGGVHTCD